MNISDHISNRAQCLSSILTPILNFNLFSPHRHNFLKVYYGSEVKGEVDFIEGDSSMRSFSSGYYSDQGMRVTEMEVTTRTLSVRPRKLFGVSTEFWSEFHNFI